MDIVHYIDCIDVFDTVLMILCTILYFTLLLSLYINALLFSCSVEL